MGKHRADGGAGFDPHGRSNHGAADGDQNPGRTAENDAAAKFSQAEADARAARYAERHQGNSSK